MGDVTQSLQLERMLDERREFTESLLKNASVPLFVIDTNHRVIVWNRALAELTGVPAGEMVGSDRHWQPFYPENRPTLSDLVLDGRLEDLGEYYEVSRNNTGVQGSARVEGWCRNVNGKDRYFIIDAAPVQRGGELAAVIETLYDITDLESRLAQKQVALAAKHECPINLFRQVEQAKQEWERTVDCIAEAVVLVDGDGRIRRCNRAFARFTAIPYQQLIARDCRELLRSLALDIDSIKGVTGELFHEPSRRWFTLRRSPYQDGNGEVVTLHDLTEMKLASERLSKAYQNLQTTHCQLLQQEKLASIGQLAAGIAHEINNPIGFISSNIRTLEKYLVRLEGFLEFQSEQVNSVASPQLLLEIAAARGKFKVDHILGDIRNLISESTDGVERVQAIVQNLKSFSRVDQALCETVDLNQCIESTVKIAWNELKYKTTLHKEYGELPPVRCFPQQLSQVFLNLLVNAAHAIEKKGEIYIRTWREGEMICVSISDTGKGIPEPVLNRIFEPFFTTKEMGKGTGLGLSISYDIINKHGGTIEVASRPGEGSTFNIRLPIEPQPGEVTAADTPCRS